MSMLSITEKTKATLIDILVANEGKSLRIFFKGHG